MEVLIRKTRPSEIYTSGMSGMDLKSLGLIGISSKADLSRTSVFPFVLTVGLKNREFGMQGYPDIRTVEEWDDDKTQLFPQSRTSVNHNKAVGDLDIAETLADQVGRVRKTTRAVPDGELPPCFRYGELYLLYPGYAG
jgi:hypothetical protein